MKDRFEFPLKKTEKFKDKDIKIYKMKKESGYPTKDANIIIAFTIGTIIGIITFALIQFFV
jgi:capsular polysaccharide biosynthesis protein